MAAIGRRRAVMQRGRFHSTGAFAWLMWLLVHIYFLSGFKNRMFVLVQWGWSYLTFARGSRLIVSRHWRSYADPSGSEAKDDFGLALAQQPLPQQPLAPQTPAPHSGILPRSAPPPAASHPQDEARPQLERRQVLSAP
jgi:hypothetical protein